MKKLLNILLTLAAVVNSLQVSSQEITWQNGYGGLKSDDLHGIVNTSFGTLLFTNIYVNDLQVPNYHGSDDALLIALDTSGNFLWHRCFGGSDIDWFSNIIASTDNSYYALGTSLSTDGDLDSIPLISAEWLIKFDSNFNILWQKRVPFILDEFSDASVTNDGGLLISGNQVCSFFPTEDFSSVILAKLSNTGDIEWEIEVSDGCHHQHHDLAGLVKRTKKKGVESYYLGAFINGQLEIFEFDVAGNLLYSNSEHNVGLVEPLENGYLAAGRKYGTSSYDIHVIRIDSQDSVLWQKDYGGTCNERVDNLFSLPNGSFLVYGMTGSNNGDVKGFHGNDPSNDDNWVFTIDSVGNLLSSWCFGSFDDEGSSPQWVSRKDNYQFTLATRSTENSGDINCLPSPPSWDIWTYNIKLCEVIYGPAPARPIGPPSVHSNLTPQSTYSTTYINAALGYEWSLQPTTAGTIMQAGNFITITWNPGFKGNVALYTRYATECGQSAWSEAHFVQVNGSTGICDKEASLVKVWPNPNQGRLNIELPLNISLPASLRLSNAQGQVMISQNLDQLTQVIDLGTLPSGLYFYQLQSTELNIVGKLLLTSNQ
jgi:hypothetical protein